MSKYMYLCTLFDSNYIDKGLVLYYSLKNVCDNFVLYILALDQKTYDILFDLNLDNVKIIAMDQFETEELIQVKKDRSRGEYCWTCTPAIIKFVLDNYSVECCTYIDADLFFYQSPQILLDEFYHSKKSVGLVMHRFPDTYYGKIREKNSGKYCVQFNTFMNDENGKKLLDMWYAQCLENCSLEGMGDQLYITNWGIEYEFVYEYKHLGGGVAPWNLPKYKIKLIDNNLYIVEKGIKYKFIFYHFHGLRYSGDGRAKINVITKIDGSLVKNKVVKAIYYPYLNCIETVRNVLKIKYGVFGYEDGCKREFSVVKFDLKKFCVSFFYKIQNESLWSAIDLVIRVVRKKKDIINLSNVKGER